MRARVLSNLLKRRVLAVMVLVFAVLGGTAIYVQAGKVTTTYRTAPVVYGTITQTIGMAGNLAPVTEADLNFAATGTVQSVTATVGETVVKGKRLAAQDSTLLAAQLSQAKATLSSAQAKLAQDEAVSSTTPQTIQIDAAQVQIEAVNVKTLKHQLAWAVIVSPINGIVSQVNIKAGQSVTGGSTTYAIVVYTPGAYQVTGTVSDAQVNLVAQGQTVQVTPAGSTQALLGKVTLISPAATISSGVATFGVTAQLTDTSNSIKPGISATASIVVKQVVHVLTVPTSAVHTTAAGSTVQILVNGSPQSVSVQVGASDPLRTEILSGLQLNQVVVIAVVTSSVPSSGGAGTVLGGGGGRGGGGGGVTRGGG
jgi:RND family efflux transporter MFP subunit